MEDNDQWTDPTETDAHESGEEDELFLPGPSWSGDYYSFSIRNVGDGEEDLFRVESLDDEATFENVTINGQYFHVDSGGKVVIEADDYEITGNTIDLAPRSSQSGPTL